MEVVECPEFVTQVCGCDCLRQERCPSRTRDAKAGDEDEVEEHVQSATEQAADDQAALVVIGKDSVGEDNRNEIGDKREHQDLE